GKRHLRTTRLPARSVRGRLGCEIRVIGEANRGSRHRRRGLASCRSGLTLPSRGRPQAGFAHLRPPLMSNVRRRQEVPHMLTGTCHGGAVQVEIPRRPRMLTNCNCSISRRYGVLWAYYKASTVRVICEPGATESYSWGRKGLNFVRC